MDALSEELTEATNIPVRIVLFLFSFLLCTFYSFAFRESTNGWHQNLFLVLLRTVMWCGGPQHQTKF